MRISRRKFLRIGSGASFALVSTRVFAAPALVGLKPLNVRTLSFDCTNTGEQLNDVDYWIEGQYVPDALCEIDDVSQALRSPYSAYETRTGRLTPSAPGRRM